MGSSRSNTKNNRVVERMQDANIKVTIVSNNNQLRVKSFRIRLESLYSSAETNTKIVQESLKLMGIEKEETVVIGDQLLTDIFGGNRKGLHTILVVPVASSDAFFTKFNRMIERRIMAGLKRRGMITWEEEVWTK